MTNTQANVVWRPCAVAVVFTGAVERTVSVSRVAGSLEYLVSAVTNTAQTYVYEFETEYWCGVSNGLKVTVTPASTGTVEVVFE